MSHHDCFCTFEKGHVNDSTILSIIILGYKKHDLVMFHKTGVLRRVDTCHVH